MGFRFMGIFDRIIEYWRDGIRTSHDFSCNNRACMGWDFDFWWLFIQQSRIQGMWVGFLSILYARIDEFMDWSWVWLVFYAKIHWLMVWFRWWLIFYPKSTGWYIRFEFADDLEFEVWFVFFGRRWLGFTDCLVLEGLEFGFH